MIRCFSCPAVFRSASVSSFFIVFLEDFSCCSFAFLSFSASDASDTFSAVADFSVTFSIVADLSVTVSSDPDLSVCPSSTSVNELPSTASGAGSSTCVSATSPTDSFSDDPSSILSGFCSCVFCISPVLPSSLSPTISDTSSDVCSSSFFRSSPALSAISSISSSVSAKLPSPAAVAAASTLSGSTVRYGIVCKYSYADFVSSSVAYVRINSCPYPCMMLSAPWGSNPCGLFTIRRLFWNGSTSCAVCSSPFATAVAESFVKVQADVRSSLLLTSPTACTNDARSPTSIT